MELLYLVLATFAISHVLVYTDGPGGIIYKIRNNKVVTRAGLMECLPCVSFWVALIISLVYFRDSQTLFFHVFAAMGGAIALDSLKDI